MDVIRASSDRALAAANRQLRGDLGRHMNGLIADLLNVLARIEAYIDFPEEDLPPEDDNWITSELELLTRETDRLLATSRYGALLRDGIKTVIVGPPNAGKSSLLNRIIGRNRALVSPEPGTTRDFLEERMVVGPHCLRIIDTAGINPSPAPLEKLGIEKTIECLAEADLCLLVIDSSNATDGFDDVLRLIPKRERVIVVYNKCDLTPAPTELPVDIPVVRTSVVTGAGMDALLTAMVDLAERFRDDFGGDMMVINARHAEALREARVGLRSAMKKIGEHEPMEIIASELRQCLFFYGKIAGKVDNERVLDQLFASFCIGK
jgi:tRNA modification GTPase